MSGFLRLETDRPDPAWMRETIAAQALPAALCRGAGRGRSIRSRRPVRDRARMALPRRRLGRSAGVVRIMAGGRGRRSARGRRMHAAPHRGRLASARRGASRARVPHRSSCWPVAPMVLRCLAAPSTALSVVRGQTSLWPANTPRPASPALPIADAGYVLTLADGSVLCGASSSRCRRSTRRRTSADRRANLQRLQRLTGSRIANTHRRVRRRPRRLPPRRARPPAVDRRRCPATRLGRRSGSTSRASCRACRACMCSARSARAASPGRARRQVLAAQIAGAPWPLEASLLDAVTRRASSSARRGVRNSAS